MPPVNSSFRIFKKKRVIPRTDRSVGISCIAPLYRSIVLNIENPGCTMLIGTFSVFLLCRRLPRRFAPRNDSGYRQFTRKSNCRKIVSLCRGGSVTLPAVTHYEFTLALSKSVLPAVREGWCSAQRITNDMIACGNHTTIRMTLPYRYKKPPSFGTAAFARYFLG